MILKTMEKLYHDFYTTNLRPPEVFKMNERDFLEFKSEVEELMNYKTDAKGHSFLGIPIVIGLVDQVLGVE